MLAIVAGYLVMAVAVTVATLLAAKLMLGSIALDGSVRPTAMYLCVNVTYSFVFAVLGGYLAATWSRRHPIIHASALGVVILLLGLLSAIRASGPQPSWYPPLVTVGGAGFAVMGGYLRAMQIRPRPTGVAAASG